MHHRAGVYGKKGKCAPIHCTPCSSPELLDFAKQYVVGRGVSKVFAGNDWVALVDGEVMGVAEDLVLDENGVPISEYNLLMSTAPTMPAVAAARSQASVRAPQVKLEARDGGAKRVHGAIAGAASGTGSPQQVHASNLLGLKASFLTDCLWSQGCNCGNSGSQEGQDLTVQR